MLVVNPVLVTVLGSRWLELCGGAARRLTCQNPPEPEARSGSDVAAPYVLCNKDSVESEQMSLVKWPTINPGAQ